MAKAAEKGKGGFNIFECRRATEAMPATHHQRSGATLEQIEVANSLNSDLRERCRSIRRNDSSSQVFQPPHLTVSVNAQKHEKKAELMKLAAKANQLTEAIAGKSFRPTGYVGQVSKRASMAPALHKHHDSGFRDLEFGSKVTESKRVFNANSQSKPTAKHDRELGPAGALRAKEAYNPLTGSVVTKYESANPTNNRKTLLPPQKRYDNEGAGKREYRDNINREPRTFHRQNGDFTYF